LAHRYLGHGNIAQGLVDEVIDRPDPANGANPATLVRSGESGGFIFA
jgi:hypothetical protein